MGSHEDKSYVNKSIIVVQIACACLPKGYIAVYDLYELFI